jgi:hypothetical protein
MGRIAPLYAAKYQDCRAAGIAGHAEKTTQQEFQTLLKTEKIFNQQNHRDKTVLLPTVSKRPE